jgi:tetratricopeptide (TPR) repeat protein
VLSAGIKLTQLGRAEGALPFFEHVRGLDPLYLVNLKTLAAAYLEAGQPEPAAHTSRQILELSPSDPQTPGLFAFALVELGFAEEALLVAASDPLLFTRLVVPPLAVPPSVSVAEGLVTGVGPVEGG